MNEIPSAPLATGARIPRLGFGTWKIPDGRESFDAVKAALGMGYRLIDTASLYGNEKSVGEALRESGIPREEIFLTTKLWPQDYFSPRKAFEKSLSLLGLDYVDLYLVHWPIPFMPKGVWPALEKIYEEKLSRAIGVSNFGIGDIETLLSYAKIPPAVNQIKFSPFDYAEEVLKCCRAHDIVVEAYSPLTRGARLDDATIGEIAKAHGKTPAQVMLRWCLEHETIPLPKSTNTDRMKENMDIFDWSLSPEEMRQLDLLSD